VAVTPSQGAKATEQTVYGIAAPYERTVAARLEAGEILVSGTPNTASCRGLPLKKLAPDLSIDGAFASAAAPAYGQRCVAPFDYAGKHVVGVVAGTGSRSFVLLTHSQTTEVWALDANGDVETTFGSAGHVDVPGLSSGGFAAAGYLYLQLWDSYSTLGGRPSGGHFRRIKL
jgi:hypothetical protein